MVDGSGSLGRQKTLHYAADSVTNAMSSLVKELKTGESPTLSQSSSEEKSVNSNSNGVQKNKVGVKDFEHSEWSSDKDNGNQQQHQMPPQQSQWQEQFAQWNLNSQK